MWCDTKIHFSRVGLRREMFDFCYSGPIFSLVIYYEREVKCKIIVKCNTLPQSMLVFHYFLTACLRPAVTNSAQHFLLAQCTLVAASRLKSPYESVSR